MCILTFLLTGITNFWFCSSLKRWDSPPLNNIVVKFKVTKFCIPILSLKKSWYLTPGMISQSEVRPVS
jgi:hypothetical protein